MAPTSTSTTTTSTTTQGQLEETEQQLQKIFTPASQLAFADSNLPQTTTERQRASTTEQSLERDVHLPEEVTEHVAGIADEESAANKTVLYLAYGSNLYSKTFQGRRGIRPLSQVNVLVPSLRLTFDLPGLPYIEPCVAGTGYRDANASKPQNQTLSKAHTDDARPATEKSPLVSSRREYHKDLWHKPLVGVVYEVTVSDYAKIIATEGGGSGYHDIIIDCYPFPESFNPTHSVPEFPDSQPFKAHTLLSPAADADRIEAAQSSIRRHEDEVGSPTIVSAAACSLIPLINSKPKNPARVRPDRSYAQPSARYLNLLTSGAAEHDLPHEYRQFLAQIRPYRITTLRQRIGQVIFVSVWAPVLVLTMILSRILAGPDGRSPAWLRVLTESVFAGVWNSYDSVFRNVFGDGERTYGDD